MEDDEIIGLDWQRSEGAVRKTAAKYGTYCTVISENILHSSQDSEKCVNDTFLRAGQTIPQQRPQCFRAYMGQDHPESGAGSPENANGRKEGRRYTDSCAGGAAEVHS